MIGIILCFNYLNDPEYNFLPGIIIDIYLSYNYMKKHYTNVYLITDIKDDNCEIFKNSLIDTDICSIIKIIKTRKEYIYYENLEYITSKLNILFENSVFFYYSGHSNHEGIVLPFFNINFSTLEVRKREILSFELLYNIIKKSKIPLNQSLEKTGIIIILDCCYGNSLFLPYHLYNKVYRKCSKNYINKNIILFNSSKDNQVSINSNKGSVFTKILFKTLSLNDNSVNFIYENIEKELSNWSDLQIYSSYPNIKELF